MSDLTTKAGEIRAGLVERLRDDRHCNDWYLRQEAAALIEQQAAELAEKERRAFIAEANFEAIAKENQELIDKLEAAEARATTAESERGELLREKERLERERDEAREALIECEGYFDNRADADCDQDGFVPNKEMRLLAVVREAIASTSQDSARILADAHSKSPDASSQSERIAVLCPHAPTYDAGLCCGHPDDCTFVSPAALAPLGEE